MSSSEDKAKAPKAQLDQALVGTDEITVLKTTGGLRLAKLWKSDGTIDGYGKAKHFRLMTETVDGIVALSELLTRLERDQTACIIRGRYVGDDEARERLGDAFHTGLVLRRNDLFEDQPLHAILIEVDDYTTGIDPVANPEGAVTTFIANELPPEFQGVSCHWQLSNSAGHAKAAGLLKVHIWYWLRRPYTSVELRAWARSSKSAIDASVFQKIQVHYTARPVFEKGVADPVSPRSGYLELFDDDVDLDLTELLEQRETEKAEAERRVAEKRAEREAKAASGDKAPNTIEAFNQRHAIEEQFIEYGYEDDGQGNWRSPHQESDSHATKVFESDDGSSEYWVSLSGSDAEAGLGHETKGGARTGDAFDLFVHWQHDNDFTAALQAASMELAEDEFENLEEMEMLPAAEGGDGAEPEGDEDGARARRERQREENRAIGEEVPVSVLPEMFTPKRMAERFAFAHRGSMVVDLQNPRVGYALADFKNLTAGSRLKIGNREVPVVNIWLKDATRRITVAGRTFRPGFGQFTIDPDGSDCVNTWKAVERPAMSARGAEHVAAFEGHVRYLFGDATDRFLDWLAHIEQRPGELPHTAWLHISGQTGTGRNWVASVLSRIWRGYTAASFDLPGTLATGFNAALSSKLLAYVDELKEGGRDGTYRFSENLKSLITAERRPINEKYGRMWTEYNCCRFLLFSNHMTAIPIDDTDRRIEVAAWEGKKQSPAYYTRLYALLRDDTFIRDVASWLSARDLSWFNPGAHASMNAVKAQMIDGQKTDAKRYAQALAERWPADLITCEALAQVIDPDGNNWNRSAGRMTALVRATATEAGIYPFTRRVKIDGKATRLYLIRNKARWMAASGPEVAQEVKSAMPTELECDWRDYIDGLGAEVG